MLLSFQSQFQGGRTGWAGDSGLVAARETLQIHANQGSRINQNQTSLYEVRTGFRVSADVQPHDYWCPWERTQRATRCLGDPWHG